MAPELDMEQERPGMMTMTPSHSKLVPFLLAVAVVAGLSGCGRKGDFDSLRPAPSQFNGVKNDTSGTKKTDVEDRPFVLDPLL